VHSWIRDVGLTPESDRLLHCREVTRWARKRYMHCSREYRYSITLSLLARREGGNGIQSVSLVQIEDWLRTWSPIARRSHDKGFHQ
jgi:hypothetical protein